MRPGGDRRRWSAWLAGSLAVHAGLLLCCLALCRLAPVRREDPVGASPVEIEVALQVAVASAPDTAGPVQEAEQAVAAAPPDPVPMPDPVAPPIDPPPPVAVPRMPVVPARRTAGGVRAAAAAPTPGVTRPDASHEAAPAAPATPAGPAEIAPGWRSAMAAWLQAHKTYPDEARAQGEAGNATVRFTVDRGGHVLAFALVHGTGSVALDAAVTRMLTGAQLPAFPAGMAQDSTTVTVTIRYALE